MTPFKSVIKSAILVSAIFPLACFAAHPLVSDDTGTQGLISDDAGTQAPGKFQLENNVDSSSLTIDGTRTRVTAVNTTLTHGVTNTMDVAVNLPYLSIRQDGTPRQSGTGDITLLAKWRFYENGPFGLALKPQIFLPTGNKDKGLGNGKTGSGLTALGAYEKDALMVLGNVGYAFANNDLGLRKDIWTVSAAALYAVTPKTKLLFDLGIYRNADSQAKRNPSFFLVGLAYGVNENTDLDVGVKKGLNKAEVDYSVGLGMTYRWGH